MRQNMMQREGGGGTISFSPSACKELNSDSIGYRVLSDLCKKKKKAMRERVEKRERKIQRKREMKREEISSS